MGEMLKYEYLPEEEGYAVSKGIYFDTQIEELTIPSTHAGKPVIEVGSFGGLEHLKKVTIPEGVLRLGDACFQRCPKLESLVIPESVEMIGRYLCEEDASLTSVTLSSKLQIIPELAFNGTAITSITLGKEISRIDRHAFSYCPNLSSFEVSSENQNYTTEDGVLYSKDMTELVAYPTGRNGAFVVPDGVTSLNITCFEGAMGLTSVDCGKTLIHIGERAFFGCENLASFKMPNTVTAIDTDAFYHCKKLANVSFSNKLQGIGDHAFMGCTSITRIYLPSTCIDLGLYPFLEMDQVTSFEVASGNPRFFSSQGVLYDREGVNGAPTLLVGPRSFQGVLKIPNTIVRIDPFAFSNTPGLTAVVVPLTMKEVYDVFENCPHFGAIYYMGQKEDWQQIEFSEGTGKEFNIPAVYYYSEKRPENVPDANLYWHYADGIPTNWN